jgi:hypothetical protein
MPMILLALAALARSGSAEEAEVMRPVRAIVAGVAAHDSAMLAAQLRPDADVTIVAVRPDGSPAIRHLTAAEFSASIKPGPERLEPRLAQPVIRIDGDIAMVWTPYLFVRDGKLDHCGANHFDLIREAGAWKIQNVTWSTRTAHCG